MKGEKIVTIGGRDVPVRALSISEFRDVLHQLGAAVKADDLKPAAESVLKASTGYGFQDMAGLAEGEVVALVGAVREINSKYLEVFIRAGVASILSASASFLARSLAAMATTLAKDEGWNQLVLPVIWKDPDG